MKHDKVAKPKKPIQDDLLLDMPAAGWVMLLCHFSLYWATIVLFVMAKILLFASGTTWPGVVAFGAMCAVLYTPMSVLVMFQASRNKAWANKAKHQWHQAEGTVVKSDYEYVEGTFFRYRNGLDIQVAFSTDTGKYIANNVCFGWMRGSEQREKLEFFYSGRSVCVYYDPSNPARHCLQSFPSESTEETMVLAYALAVVTGSLMAFCL